MGAAPALGSLGAALLATPVALNATGGSLAPIMRPSFLLFLLADAVLEAFCTCAAIIAGLRTRWPCRQRAHARNASLLDAHTHARARRPPPSRR